MRTIRFSEKGYRGTLWAHAEMQTASGTQDDVDELEKTAGWVHKLMDAKEVSKAATAVWGTGSRVPASEVETKFRSTQHLPDQHMPISSRGHTGE